MQWEILQTVFNQIIPPLNAGMNAGTAALMTWVGPYLIGGLVVYGAGSLIWASLGGRVRPFENFNETLVGGAIAVTFATNMAWFGPYVRDLVLVEGITGIGNALVGLNGGRVLSAAMFDQAWNKAFVSGLAFLRNIPWSLAGIGLVAVLLLFWISAIGAIGIGFGIWVKSVFFASVMLGVAPLFIGLFPFKPIRGWFFGWLNTTFSNVVLAALCVLVVVIVITAQTQVINAMLVNVQAGAGSGFFGLQPAVNEMQQAGFMLGGFLVNVFMGWIFTQLPGAAASITHGFAGYGHMGMGAIGAMLGGGAGGGNNSSSSTSQAPAAAPPAAPAAAPMPAPPGPSMSTSSYKRSSLFP